MISWIQHHLIRHGRWIFISLLAVIIIAFVFTIGNTPGLTTNDSNYEERIVFGIDVNNPTEMDALSRAVGLSTLLQTGTEISNSRQFQNAIADRIVQRHLIQMIGLPNPSSDDLQSFIKTLALFQNDSGQFDSTGYNRFVQNLTENPELSELSFIETLAEDYKIKQLEAVLEGPGYYTEAQSRIVADQRNTVYEVYNIKLDYEAFVPEIDESEEAIQSYYNEQKLAYETDEKIEVSYLFFSNNDTEIEIADTTSLEAHYLANKEEIDAQHRAENPDPGPDPKASSDKPKGPSVYEDPTFIKVQELVKADWMQKQQAKATEEAASEFVYTLYDKEIALDSKAFEDLKTRYQAEEKTLEVYAKNETLGKSLPSELLQSGFALNSNRYYSDPYESGDGYAVLLYRNTLVPEIPAYETVAEQVKEDYLKGEKRAQFNAEGERIQSELEAIVASGNDFLSEAEALGLTVEAHPEFNFREPPENSAPYEFQAVYRLQSGEVSQMNNYGDTAIITYLKSETVSEYEDDAEELERTIRNIKSFSQNAGKSGFYNELLSLEMSGSSETEASGNE